MPENDDETRTRKFGEQLPPGLVYLENYVDADYAHRLVEFLCNETSPSSSNNKDKEVDGFVDLKKRRVRHYGYEFRYGTNDCDLTQPLTDPDKRMPELCNELIDRMIADNLVSTPPDQLTVNFYEPGHGIGKSY